MIGLIDTAVRSQVYGVAMRTGAPPSSDEIAAAISVDRGAVVDALRRLADAHVLVLQPGSEEILMAPPFSAVPTPFRVETEELSAFANCIWDALGIPAMLHRDSTIITSCADCGMAAEISVAGGIPKGDGLLHFAIPARDWWNDIVFT